MEKNKNSDKHRTHWAANILCVCRKNWPEIVRNKLFANSLWPCTNYMNIMFTNEKYASVYAALDTLEICVPLRLMNEKLRIHLQTFCSKKSFFHEPLVNQGKVTNQLQTTGSFAKIIGNIRKCFCKHGKEQKFRQASYPLNRKHPLWLLKKPAGDGL